MEELKSDIQAYLHDHRTIPGFELLRLEQLIKTGFADCQGYEWRLLLSWSGLYVSQFEALYNIQVPQEETVDFTEWLKQKSLKPPGAKF